jgi:5'(3')-deoxyribonucleotidase
MKCLLDLDGVLTDFVKAACDRYGRCPYANGKNAGEWDIVKLLGVNPTDFWSGCGRDFWAHLPWTADGRQILDECERTFGRQNVCLLTSPPDTPGSVQGKLDWVHRELPAYRRRVLVGAAKEFCAGPSRVLVDDSDANVSRFEDAGGRAVLVPRPWNRGHPHAGRAFDAVAAGLVEAVAFSREGR